MPQEIRAEAAQLLRRLEPELQRVLGGKLLGLYLYGSLTLGNYDPGISDIDLLAVLKTEASRLELDALKAMHDDIARELPEWDNRVEVQYASAAALKNFREHASPMAVISPGEPFHVIEAGIDWLMNWYLVRETGIVLYGAPAHDLISPISQAEFIQATREHARDWLGLADGIDTLKGCSYATLTLCRALHIQSTGVQASKRTAAEWAKHEYSEWAPLIANAIPWRAGEPGTMGLEEARRQAMRFIAAANE